MAEVAKLIGVKTFKPGIYECGNAAEQAAVVTKVLRYMNKKEAYVILDCSDYHIYSNYGREMALALHDSLQGGGINTTVRYFHKYPLQCEGEPNAYNLYTEPSLCRVDKYFSNERHPDRAVILVSSEGLLSDAHAQDPRTRDDIVSSLCGTGGLKVLVTPFAMINRRGTPITFIHTIKMDSIITREAKPLEKLPQEILNEMLGKLDNDFDADSYRKGIISYFLRSNSYREYMKAIKIIAQYDVVHKTKASRERFGKNELKHTSLEELEKAHPDIPAYVFVSITASGMMSYATNGSRLFDVTRNFVDNHISESDYQ